MKFVFYDGGKKKGQKNLQSTIKLLTCHKAQCNSTVKIPHL
jgi:hypothetical protein